MQFGMPTLIENNTLADNIALCRELGLSFVELNMIFPEYQVEKLEWTDLLAKMGADAGGLLHDSSGRESECSGFQSAGGGGVSGDGAAEY